MSKLQQNIRLSLAQLSEQGAIKALMHRAIEELQAEYLTPEQVEASHAGMGLDTQLIKDGTYFCAYEKDILVGCGGWSFRATLHGGDHSQGRDIRKLKPVTERARIRAMYTHPEHTRKGIGRLILQTSENAARTYGFAQLEMAATMAGIPFYKKCGYSIESEWFDKGGTVPVPLATMVKSI